jgi:hypothetical protein
VVDNLSMKNWLPYGGVSGAVIATALTYSAPMESWMKVLAIFACGLVGVVIQEKSYK